MYTIYLQNKDRNDAFVIKIRGDEPQFTNGYPNCLLCQGRIFVLFSRSIERKEAIYVKHDVPDVSNLVEG